MSRGKLKPRPEWAPGALRSEPPPHPDNSHWTAFLLARIEALERKERARAALQWINTALVVGIAAALLLGGC